MTASRFAVSMDSGLARTIRKAAGKTPVSAWLADAAERKLRAEGLLRVVKGWETEHGDITDAEVKKALQKRRPRRAK